MRSPTDDYQRDKDLVPVAVFSNYTEATFHDFEGKLSTGDTVSVAIEETHRQVIAFVNHSRNTEGHLLNKMKAGDLVGTLFFIAFPSVLLGGIAYKAFQPPSNVYMGYGAIALAVLIVVLILWGLARQSIISRKALELV